MHFNKQDDGPPIRRPPRPQRRRRRALVEETSQIQSMEFVQEPELDDEEEFQARRPRSLGILGQPLPISSDEDEFMPETTTLEQVL